MVLDYTYINTAREFNSRIETLSGYAARGSGQAGEAGVSWSGGVALYRRARNASRRVEQPFPPGLDLATHFHTVCKLNITTPVGADIKVLFLPRVAASPCQKLQVNFGLRLYVLGPVPRTHSGENSTPGESPIAVHLLSLMPTAYLTLRRAV